MAGNRRVSPTFFLYDQETKPTPAGTALIARAIVLGAAWSLYESPRRRPLAMEVQDVGGEELSRPYSSIIPAIRAAGGSGVNGPVHARLTRDALLRARWNEPFNAVARLGEVVHLLLFGREGDIYYRGSSRPHYLPAAAEDAAQEVVDSYRLRPVNTLTLAQAAVDVGNLVLEGVEPVLDQPMPRLSLVMAPVALTAGSNSLPENGA